MISFITEHVSFKFIQIKKIVFNKKIIIIILIIMFNIIIIFHFKDGRYGVFFEEEINNNKMFSTYCLTLEEKMKNYKTKKFVIIRRLESPNSGFFSFYIVHLGCINKYLLDGYIPIIDLQSFNNVYNKGNTSKINPWELFFYQPYNYTLEEVKKYAKKYKYLICTGKFFRPDEVNIYYDNNSIFSWHNFAMKYMPIKKEILQEVYIIMKKLFHNSKNILGVLIRGTDYISKKPKGHSIPPKVEQVVKDVKIMDKKYKYDYIFFSTEDEIIKQKFIHHFVNKIKVLNPSVIINYNYKKKYNINLHEKIIGNLDFVKNYILNIIILSKCLDIIISRCSGAAGIFIFSKGFRNTKIYNLGLY